jgi:3-deoxy-manno-octulosonate cytidylyltransferase (CMP-KDO synthetase)
VIRRTLAVIPARLGSTRLHRKPLYPIAGRPLVEWVWRRAVGLDVFDAVVVATDSAEVAEACARFGAEVRLTREDHPSGTDRVAEVARDPAYAGFGVVANVQGDEPFLSRAQAAAAVALVRDQGWEVGTVATPIADAAEWHEPSVVKVVRADDGGALLFTRAPVPHPRDAQPDFGSGRYLRHVGLYVYRRDALLRWVSLAEGALERIERLEQLRALAAGLRIGVALCEAAPGGVDTPADAARAEQIIMDSTRSFPREHSAI